MTPVEVATKVIEALYWNDICRPQDWDTDDTKTIGEWKSAIIHAVLEFQQEWQAKLDAKEAEWQEWLRNSQRID